jgi:flagellar L-ring protein precursor FlgH
MVAANGTPFANDQGNRITVTSQPEKVKILRDGSGIDGDNQQVGRLKVVEFKDISVIRPQDISSQNTVAYEKMAEARISYGGRGQLSDAVKTPIGQEILTNILPL